MVSGSCLRGDGTAGDSVRVSVRFSRTGGSRLVEPMCRRPGTGVSPECYRRPRATLVRMNLEDVAMVFHESEDCPGMITSDDTGELS